MFLSTLKSGSISLCFIYFLVFCNLQNINSLPIYENTIKHCREDKLEYNELERSSQFRSINRIPVDMIIDIKFVVFHNGNNGKVSSNQINKQIEVLNNAYGGKFNNGAKDSKIKFRLMNTQYVNNNDYYTSCQENDLSIANLYRGDTSKYLTIYTCDSPYLGWAYYPWSWYEGNPNQVIYINAESFPYGSYGNYNSGFTTVHEIGHFFGLPHTFSSTEQCSTDGDDGISDTPLEKTPGYGCNYNRDTCPNDLGKDPVWNFMDYSDDYCINRFSDGQIDKILYILQIYRPKLVAQSILNFNPPIINPTNYPTNKPTNYPTPETIESCSSSECWCISNGGNTCQNNIGGNCDEDECYNRDLCPGAGYWCYKEPTLEPVSSPTNYPTYEPVSSPTNYPTYEPVSSPTNYPTYEPVSSPTYEIIESCSSSECWCISNGGNTCQNNIGGNCDEDECYNRALCPGAGYWCYKEPTYEPVSSPTYEPVNSPTNYPTNKPVSSPTYEPVSSPTYEIIESCSSSECWCISNGGNTCQNNIGGICDEDECYNRALCPGSGYWCYKEPTYEPVNSPTYEIIDSCSSSECWCISNGGNTCQNNIGGNCDEDECYNRALCPGSGYWCDESPSLSIGSISQDNTDINKLCDIRQSDGTSWKWGCFNRDPYNVICKWNDHYNKCMPKIYETNDIDIYCDVRDNYNNPSRWKCTHLPYTQLCNWNNNLHKCIPKLEINKNIEITQNPTKFPTKFLGKGKGKGKKG
jgi:hypothetical protein